MEKKLTPFQQKLVDDLTNEFTKLNGKPTVDKVNRFTFDTIAECNKEEERFINTLTKHNKTMSSVFIKLFNDEIKEFKKEFGKVIDIQIGHYYFGSNNLPLSHSEKDFIQKNNILPLENNHTSEMNLLFVSKTKSYEGDNRYDYCNGHAYHKIYVDFKREHVSHKLESGKIVSGWKIIGLEYRTSDYLAKGSGVTAYSLDELIQTEKRIQIKLVELANLK